MKTAKIKLALCLLNPIFFAACGGSSSNDSTPPQNPHRVAWESIPSDYNPQITSSQFKIDGAEKIQMDLFGSDSDVTVTYGPTPDASTAVLKLYTVFKDFATFGSLNVSSQQKTIFVSNEGRYECAIHIHNGSITDLKGGCYVRIELILPVGSTVEVYNLKELITQRFIPIDNETFIKSIKDATWPKDKQAVIDQYVGSYAGTGKSIALTTKELGQAIHEFYLKEDKLTALGKLQAAVTDRENLENMIQDVFNYFEQNEARQIVGLPQKEFGK